MIQFYASVKLSIPLYDTVYFQVVYCSVATIRVTTTIVGTIYPTHHE